MFFTFEDVVRLSRVFRRRPCSVSDELRGWHWDEYPLAPAYSVRINASDLAGGFCPTNRHIYVRYILKSEERPNFRLELGSFIHRVYHMVSCTVKSILYEGAPSGDGFKEVFKNVSEEAFAKAYSGFQTLKSDFAKRVFEALWNYASNVYAASLDRLRTVSPYMSLDGLVSLVIPMTVEFPVDGTLIGLNRAIRVDAILHPHTVVELKTRGFRPEYEVGLASYALAIESQYEIPVNYAVLSEVKFDRGFQGLKVYERHVLISDELRGRFIERRDSAMRMIEEELDPGMPDVCSEDCPFLGVCNSG